MDTTGFAQGSILGTSGEAQLLIKSIAKRLRDAHIIPKPFRHIAKDGVILAKDYKGPDQWSKMDLEVDASLKLGHFATGRLDIALSI